MRISFSPVAKHGVSVLYSMECAEYRPAKTDQNLLLHHDCTGRRASVFPRPVFFALFRGAFPQPCVILLKRIQHTQTPSLPSAASHTLQRKGLTVTGPSQ